MPCIHIQTNRKVSAEEEKSLREKFGEAISLFPGKSESWLMFLLEDGCRMAFQGKTEKPMAFEEFKLCEILDKGASQKMPDSTCEFLKEILKFSSDRVYVRYEATKIGGWTVSIF